MVAPSAGFDENAGTLATLAAPAAAQAVWEAEELGAGHWEFRLSNEDGAETWLVCRIDGVTAGFAFPESPAVTENASIRGVPGERQNIAIAPASDGDVRVTTTRGLEALLRMLRNAAIVNVRVGRERASFEVFGSAPVVSECLERQRPGSESC